MDESLREWSEWWLPGGWESRAMGELRFDPTDGPRLTLFQYPPKLYDDQYRVPTLLGHTFEGEALTLIGSTVTQQQTRVGAGAHVRVRLRASALLRGGHREEGADVSVRRARVQFAGLRELCFRTLHLDGEPASFLSMTPGAQRRITVDGGSLTFEYTEARENAKFGESWERDAAILVEADEALSLHDFEERWIMPLQGLVILASREPTVQKRLTLLLPDPNAGNYHPAITHGSPDDIWTQEPVEVWTATPGLNAEPSSDYERLLVPFAALGTGFEEFVARWFRLYAELGEAALFLMSALGSRLFLENKLLNEMSFGESYHRLLHDEPPIAADDHEAYLAAMLDTITNPEHRQHYRVRLSHAAGQTERQRLKWLVARAHELLPAVARLDTHLVGDLIATRNGFTHLDPDAPPTLIGSALFYALARLELVIQTNVLLDLGLTPGLVASLVLNSYYNEVPVVAMPEA